MDNKINKISFKEANNFFVQFFKGMFPRQRYGQAFLNKFFPGVLDPDLFYQEDEGISIKESVEKYVDPELR